MNVAGGGSGGSPSTLGHSTGVDLALRALVAVLVVAAAVGGVLVWQAHQDRASAATQQQRYGAVLAAAHAEAEAFINIRYDDAQAGIDELAEGATGEFREKYTSSSERVVEVLTRNRSVMEGEVHYAGVVDVDQDSAVVLAATTGTVANKQTADQPVARNFRLRLELVYEDGRWLTNDLQIVG